MQIVGIKFVTSSYMGFWNYRLVKRTFESGESELSIHEAYYAGDSDSPSAANKPDSITENPITLSSEDIAGLQWQLKEIQKAFDRPVLNYEEF